MAQDFVEHACGPAAVGDARAALVAGRADDLEPGNAALVEPFGGESEPALSSAPARSAQRDTAVGTRRLLEVAPSPG